MFFKNPDFLHDENSAQYLSFLKFVRMLKRDFIALSPTAFDEILDHVSDCCEAFYQIDKANDSRKETNIYLKEQIVDLKAQLPSQVA